MEKIAVFLYDPGLLLWKTGRTIPLTGKKQGKGEKQIPIGQRVFNLNNSKWNYKPVSVNTSGIPKERYIG
jgi:hypothetical protein